MGAMYIIHASITEVCICQQKVMMASLLIFSLQYLIFFGSPVGTEGHTGRHTVRWCCSVIWILLHWQYTDNTLLAIRPTTISTSWRASSVHTIRVHFNQRYASSTVYILYQAELLFFADLWPWLSAPPTKRTCKALLDARERVLGSWIGSRWVAVHV